jgi:hypothetical protein
MQRPCWKNVQAFIASVNLAAKIVLGQRLKCSLCGVQKRLIGIGWAGRWTVRLRETELDLSLLYSTPPSTSTCSLGERHAAY